MTIMYIHIYQYINNHILYNKHVLYTEYIQNIYRLHQITVETMDKINPPLLRAALGNQLPYPAESH